MTMPFLILQKPLTTILPSKWSLQLHKPTVLEESLAPVSVHRPSPILTNPGDSIYDRRSRTLIIRCANDTFISVPTVKQQDRNLLAAKEWWNGVNPTWLENGVLKLGNGPTTLGILE